MAGEPGIAQVRFRNDLKRTYVHDARGKFTSFQRQMRQAHERMAVTVADEIQKVLIDRVRETGRPQEPRTYRGQGEDALVRAIVDPANRTAGYAGFRVMDPAFLEGLPGVGEYYRNLEVGTAEFVGRQIRGYFIMPGRSFASKERFRTQAILVNKGTAGVIPGEEGALNQAEVSKLGLGKEAAGYGGGNYGTRRGTTSTNPISTESMFAPLKQSKSGKSRGNAPIITISHPIIGYHYVEEGMANWNASGNELKEVQQAASSAGLRMAGYRVIPPPL